MTEFAGLFGYFLAVVMVGVAYYCWRKALNFHTLLVESASRFDALRQHGQNLEKERAKLGEKLAAAKETAQKLEKQLGANKQKIDADMRRLETRAIEAEEQRQGLELKLEHLKPQVEVLTRQLQESDLNLREAQTKVSYAANAAEKKHNEARTQLDKQIQEWKEKCFSLERQLKEKDAQNVKRAGAEVDPEKYREAQRKAAHFESLYRSMRGLREMADERNKNWEVALRKLAGWTVKQKNTQSDIDEITIGPLVGEALEIIGERLVQDEFSGRPNPIDVRGSQAQTDAT